MGLLESIPTVEKRGGRLSVITGTVPNPFNLPPACRFEPRCPYAWDLCRQVAPELIEVRGSNQLARCHLHTPAGDSRLHAALERHEAAINVGQGPSTT
jgi:oligopeptide/dipeptide ABC transporter ATP-binding protein